jgi:hypothetical protein
MNLSLRTLVVRRIARTIVKEEEEKEEEEEEEDGDGR